MYFLHEFYGLFWAVMVILKNGLQLLNYDGLDFLGSIKMVEFSGSVGQKI